MPVILIFLFGLCVGSFLNVVVWRTYKGENLFGRSRCSFCKKNIFWYDNIPLLSFIILRGRCRHCKKKISLQYPIVELSTGVLFVLAYIQSFPLPFIPSRQGRGNIGEEAFSLGAGNIGGGVFSFLSLLPLPFEGEGWGEGVIFLRNLIFISFLIIIFVQDLRWMVILDKITIPAIILAVAFNIFLEKNWIDLFFGAIIGGGAFLFQFLLSGGKWVGGGDIRLGLLMGVLLGWKGVLAALFLSYMSGAAISLAFVFFQKKKFSSRVPFGTYLSAATVIMLLFGDEISRWYLNYF